MTLKVKYADFRQITRSRTIATAIQTAAELETWALTLLEPVFPVTKGVRLLGVTLSSLVDKSAGQTEEAQLLLWDDTPVR